MIFLYHDTDSILLKVIQSARKDCICNFIYLFIIYNSKFEHDDEILKIIPSSRFNVLVITI